MIYTILYASGNGYEIELDKRGNMYVVLIWDGHGHNYLSSRAGERDSDSYDEAETAFYAACDLYGIPRDNAVKVDHDPSNWNFD